MKQGTYITQFRQINGKRYTLQSIKTSKAEADKVANRVRSTETSVRVIRMANSRARHGDNPRLNYAVYVR
jgi:hypothetical protein